MEDSFLSRSTCGIHSTVIIAQRNPTRNKTPPCTWILPTHAQNIKFNAIPFTVIPFYPLIKQRLSQDTVPHSFLFWNMKQSVLVLKQMASKQALLVALVKFM